MNAAPWIVSLLALGLSAFGDAAAVAAGVFCADPVESGIASGATRPEAEAAAISWWSSRAGATGRGYEIWANARDPQVTCKDAAGGKFTCTAKARPCLPEGQTPQNVPKLEL
jgi:hypothetical protein